MTGCMRVCVPSLIDAIGSLLRVDDFSSRGVEESLRSDGLLEEKDIAPTAAFILRCLTIDSATRPTALELLNEDWLKEVIDK
jgi:serine/threonine-protein kinase SRPK3